MSDANEIRELAYEVAGHIAPAAMVNERDAIGQKLIRLIMATQGYMADAVEAVRDGEPESVLNDAVTALLDPRPVDGAELLAWKARNFHNHYGMAASRELGTFELPQQAGEAMDRALAAMMTTVPVCSRCGAPADHAGEC